MRAAFAAMLIGLPQMHSASMVNALCENIGILIGSSIQPGGHIDTMLPGLLETVEQNARVVYAKHEAAAGEEE